MNVVTFDKNELEIKLAEFRKQDMKDSEIAKKFLEEGYTLDSFRYDENRYKWFKRVLKDNRLI